MKNGIKDASVEFFSGLVGGIAALTLVPTALVDIISSGETGSRRLKVLELPLSDRLLSSQPQASKVLPWIGGFLAGLYGTLTGLEGNYDILLVGSNGYSVMEELSRYIMSRNLGIEEEDTRRFW